jgi:3,4-dihydroxy 2-butanone 4-phosphate synthase/GTP cyclohydrolase II
MNEDGTMARRDDLEHYAKKHDLKIGTIADLIHYRLVTEKTTQCVSERIVNTHYGEFTLKTYLDHARDEKHFAMVMGDVSGGDAPLVRVHINRSARDLLAIESSEGFKSWSTHTALEAIAKDGRGVLVLLVYPETAEDMDRNIDEMLNISTNKTTPANEVVYFQVGTGSQILMDLGISKMRLLSAPFKFSGISGFDLEVVEYIDYQESKGT